MAQQIIFKKNRPTTIVEVGKVISSLWPRLPKIAHKLISDAKYYPHERNDRFLEKPNDPREHETKWHQWGIITHSLMFERYYVKEVPNYLRRWGVALLVAKKMAELIDGISKGDLLKISIPLHDLGKFAVRRLILQRENTITVSFKEHERESSEIIREKDFSKILQIDFNLTTRHIDYISKCARYHYELAIVRDEAKNKKRNDYNLTYIHSPVFNERCRQVMRENKGFELEVGLLWLGDSLAKVETRINALTDDELNSKTEQIKKLLKRKGLPQRLLESAKQLPINVAAAETYLKLWAETELALSKV
jgi:hypothetical protein